MDYSQPGAASPLTGTWRVPGSKLILPMSAPRKEWLEARHNGLGGSDAAALMGANPYDDGTPWHVWRDKVQPVDDEQANRMMERGRRMEPIVRELFTEQTGIRTRRQGLHQSRTDGELLASVDALAEDGGGGEWKTTTSWTQRKDPEWEDRCPPLYAWQAKHYLLVTGRSHWWVCCLVVDTWTPYVWLVERDEDELELLRTVETEFWRTHVAGNIEPEFDLDHYTTQEVRDRWPSVTGDTLSLTSDSELGSKVRNALREKREAAEDLKIAEAREATAKDTLRALTQGYEQIDLDGKKAVTLKESSSTRADPAAMRDAGVFEQYSKTTSGRTLQTPGTKWA